MKYVPEATMHRIETLKRQMLKLEAALPDKISEFNLTAERLYEDLINGDKHTYDEYVEELNTLLGNVSQQMDAFFESQSDDWKNGADGKTYAAWMEAWGIDFDEFEVEDFTELTEPTLTSESDFEGLSSTPGDIAFDEDPRVKASLEHQRNVDRWKLAVMESKTTLGLLEWVAEQRPYVQRHQELQNLCNAIDGDDTPAARTRLRAALAAYETTGDHDHGRGSIAAGAPCPGGDCLVDRARKLLAVQS